jgi:PST family polysaccharide transporter
MPSSPTPLFTPDRLRHSLVSQGGAQVFKLLVSVGIGGWTARYLGPQNLGTLSYVAALVGLFGPLGSLGVKDSLSAMLCDERPLPGLLGSALLIELIGTLVIAVVLIPFAWTARNPVVVGLIGLAVVGNLFGSSEVFEVELLNRQRGTQLARFGMIQTIAGAFLSVWVLLVQAPLLVFGTLPVIQAAISAWLLAVAVQAAKPVQLLNQASWDTIRALIKRGWPLLLSGLSVMLYMKSDQVMLEWLRGPGDLGQYSVAVRVAESLYFLPVVLSNTFLPRIGCGSGQFDSDPELRQLYRSAWLLGVGMTLASMLLLPPLVPLVFGDEFLPAEAALAWLGPAAFAVATGCASGAWLNRQGHQKLIAQRSVIGALLNIVLNLLLIPRFGFVGAALATSVSYLASVYLVGISRREISANLANLAFPFRYATFQG